jgi:putative FmdB family regulatory protein
MPTYEYECKSCGHSFDAFQSINDEPLSSCPQCGKEIRRIINGGSGIIFKGQGFYVTDKKGAAGKGAVKPSSSKPSGEGTPAPACNGCAKAETGACSADKAVS